MINTSFLLLFFLILLLLFFCTYYFFKTAFNKKHQILELQRQEFEKSSKELKSLAASQKEEKGRFDEEKKKAQEKNRKVWQMSETVYIEKKKVDEQVEILKSDKEKLETEKKKVDEKIKKLWTQSMAIHKEKERINEIKTEIEIKHREVIDSVNYAKRIQDAILPSLNDISENLPNSFILFKPKNIVSGDFYWFSLKDGKIIIASVDCTGHGVPGAFMSVIGNTLLNQIVNERGIIDPAEILTQLDFEVTRSLQQTKSGSESRDGMDAAICSFENWNVDSGVVLKYAGANRPLYHVKSGVLQETKADKFPIGGLDYNNLKKFTTHTFQLQKNDSIYISTDGYADQFGKEDKKLKTKKFKEMLLAIQNSSMNEQKEYLDSFIESWKGNVEQTDDILVIGIKI
ncbi:MAG: SpoIIE family protein phosphatase [Bacteroidota bacterium]